MNRSVEPGVHELRKGQLWRIKRFYVRIVEVGTIGVRSQLLTSPSESAEPALTSGVETLWSYLHSRKGRLIQAPTG